MSLRPNRPSGPEQRPHQRDLALGQVEVVHARDAVVRRTRHLGRVRLHLLDAHHLDVGVLGIPSIKPDSNASCADFSSPFRPSRSRTKHDAVEAAVLAARRREELLAQPADELAALREPAPDPAPEAARARRCRGPRASASCLELAGDATEGQRRRDHRDGLDVGPGRARPRPRSRRCSRTAACPSRRSRRASPAAGPRRAPDRPDPRSRAAGQGRGAGPRCATRAWSRSPRSDFSRSRLAPETMPSSPSATPSSTPIPSARNTATSEIA